MFLKIAIVVHGRFYAFDLARELLHQGHDVTLFTNYPAAIVERFGIPKQHVRSFLLHGIVSRFLQRLNQFEWAPNFEPFIHSWFSQWAALKLRKERYEIIQIFSGIAEEALQSLAKEQSIKILVRGSAHIRTQFQLLEEEEQRSNLKIDKPSSWIIDREEREYELADAIVVLSTFAKNSFIKQGFDPNRLKFLPLGTQLTHFRLDLSVIEQRCQRILSGQPLRILTVGTFSLRKGAIDLLKIAAKSDINFNFRFVGAIAHDATPLLQSGNKRIELIPKQPEFQLPQMYAWADLFIFPTIEDGYAVVLSQAQAAGLPILATENCAAPDIIETDQSGWILPIRDADRFMEKLQWCHTHRLELAQMVRHVYDDFQPRDWADVAKDFVHLCATLLEKAPITPATVVNAELNTPKALTAG
jgi:glycosyltransferase involved in cell wall biosynthesis